MADKALNPYTGDYTGQRIPHLGNAVYLRLATPKGGWWADPALGSRLHELQREKDLPRVRVLAKQFAGEALAPLVQSGRARRVSVSTYDGTTLGVADSGGSRLEGWQQAESGFAGAASSQALTRLKDQSGAGRCVLWIEVEDATGNIHHFEHPVRVI